MIVQFRRITLINSVLVFIILLICVEKTESFLGHCETGPYVYKDHSTFTSYVLLNDVIDHKGGNEFQSEALKQIVAANLHTDSFWSWQVPQNHFLNEKIELAVARTVDKKKETIKLARKGEYSDAREALGTGLHTVQDFFAHSNWVEMMGSAQPNYASLSNPLFYGQPCKDDPGRLMAGYKHLTSAYFYYNHLYLLAGPVATYGYVQYTSCHPGGGKCRHGAKELFCPIGIHKDCYEYDKVHFPNAANGARHQSKLYVQEILDELDVDSVAGLMGVPQSIGIVMDITGSMSDDIEACKAAAHWIVQNDQAEKRKYVLTTFYDYSIVTKSTYDKSEFIGMIDALGWTGGGREPVFTAIFEAAQKSSRGGQLFVFTDEVGDDHEAKGPTAVYCKSRKIRTYFLMHAYYRRRRRGLIGPLEEEGGGGRRDYSDFPAFVDFVGSTQGGLFTLPDTIEETKDFVIELVSTKSLGSSVLHSTRRIRFDSNEEKLVSFFLDSSVESLSLEFSSPSELCGLGSLVPLAMGNNITLSTLNFRCTSNYLRGDFFCYVEDASPLNNPLANNTGEWGFTLRNCGTTNDVDLKIYVVSPIQISDVQYFYRLDDDGIISYSLVPEKVVAYNDVTFFVDLSQDNDDVAVGNGVSSCTYRIINSTSPITPHKPLVHDSSYVAKGKFGFGKESVTTYKGVVSTNMDCVQYIQFQCRGTDTDIPIIRTHETAIPVTGVSVMLIERTIANKTVINANVGEDLVRVDLNFSFVASNFALDQSNFNVKLEVQNLEDEVHCEVFSSRKSLLISGKGYEVFWVYVKNKEWNIAFNNQTFEFIVRVDSTTEEMSTYSYFVRIEDIEDPYNVPGAPPGEDDLEEDDPFRFPWAIPIIIVSFFVVYYVALGLVPVLVLVTCLTILLYGGIVGGTAVVAGVGAKIQKAENQKTGDGDVNYRRFDNEKIPKAENEKAGDGDVNYLRFDDRE